MTIDERVCRRRPLRKNQRLRMVMVCSQRRSPVESGLRTLEAGRIVAWQCVPAP